MRGQVFDQPNASGFAFCVLYREKARVVRPQKTSNLAFMRLLPRRSPIVCTLLLLAALFWFSRSQQKTVSPTFAPHSSNSSSASPKPSALPQSDDLDDLYHEILSAAPEGQKPLPFKTKRRVHLKPGESAIIGFWQISKDTNGLAIITPENLPDGTVKLAARLLKVTDAVAADKAVRDLFSAPFDVEQSGAMKPAEVEAALAHLNEAKGTDMLFMPTVITRAEQQASIMIGREGSDGQMVSGISLDLNASAPAADGSFNLDLGLDLK